MILRHRALPHPNQAPFRPKICHWSYAMASLRFFSANSALHFLNATTGQEFLSLPPGNPVSLPSIDGQIIYLSPPLGAPSASIQAFHIPNGRLLWTYPLPKETSVQAEMEGMIYLSAAANSTLIALRGSDGHRLWTYHSSLWS
ncbi:PQQ-binding-like beta-propeller repeat protein [Ktedonobacter racemifer]|uniref:Pyrrolo-quinoline quinone n=1 Tax=Ktedonobacter racemifer DSM 44963 TaxID=485913 RepID=D6U382_KTERA|nr:PQQ-binding-like beta-propeller repeat protein [Ktedonobacter racemifer]EFH81086.1 hypothetical protein Krac_1762 [Ktedonobacter racemifer DSM 44963]